MNTQRLPAKGPNGEPCIIERTGSSLDTSNLAGQSSIGGLASYRLGTGERLNPTEDSNVFQTLDGRRYTLV